MIKSVLALMVSQILVGNEFKNLRTRIVRYDED